MKTGRRWSFPFPGTRTTAYLTPYKEEAAICYLSVGTHNIWWEPSKPGTGSVEKRMPGRAAARPRSPCREEQLPSGRAHGPGRDSRRLKGEEAMRQIGFCDCGGGCFWAGLGRNSRH